MSILLKLISFIILYYSIISTTIKNNDTISLIYYEYSYKLSEIKVELKNREVSIIDIVQCRLAFVKDQKKENDEIFDFYSNYFTRQWIFFTNNTETVNNLLQIKYSKNELYCLGILVPKSLNYNLQDDNGIPIFEIDDNYTDLMEKSDIRNMNKNIFFSLQINHAVEYYPEDYFLFLSITILIISFTILILWQILSKKVNPVYILPYHRVGTLLIYLNNILSIILVIKSSFIRGQKIYEDEEDSSMLVDTAFITLNGMRRTVFWLVVLLLSYGWSISLQQLGVRDCKFFIKLFFVLFISLSLDQIIDFIGGPIFTLNLSEIKNFIIYSIFLYIILKKISLNIKFLKFRIHYARLFSPEYISSLMYKILVFKKFRILAISYLVLYTIVLALHKTVFSKYDETLLEAYDYLAVDFYFEYLLLLLLRPKELPENYNINLGDNINIDEGNIYRYILPKYSEVNSKICDLTKKDIDLCKKNQAPIVIIGPTNNVTDNNLEDNTSINKYFLELNIGFVDNIK